LENFEAPPPYYPAESLSAEHDLTNIHQLETSRNIPSPAARGFTPTLTLPHQGGGNSFHVSISSPSPLAGEGRVRGEIPNFSQLPPSEEEGVAWGNSNYSWPGLGSSIQETGHLMIPLNAYQGWNVHPAVFLGRWTPCVKVTSLLLLIRREYVAF